MNKEKKYVNYEAIIQCGESQTVKRSKTDKPFVGRREG